MLLVTFLSGLLFLSWDIRKWRSGKVGFYMGELGYYIGGVALAFIFFYLAVVAITPANFLECIIVPASIVGIFKSILSFAVEDPSPRKRGTVHIYIETARTLAVLQGVLGILAIFLWIGLYASNLFSHENKYNYLTIETVETNIAETNPNELRVVFEPTARKAVDKIFGQIPQVNYFEIGNAARITINEEPFFIYPIKHKRPFKAKSQGPAPGYGLVSTTGTAVKAEINEEHGNMYAPNGFLSNNVYRQIRETNLGAILFTAHYEVDDDGKPYWIIPYGEKGMHQDMLTVEGTFVVDPLTGTFEKFGKDSVPSWIDYIIPEETASSYFEWFAKYKHGWWNGKFAASPRDVLEPASGVREIYDENQKMWWFLDFTRVNASRPEAMVGYALMDPITGKIVYHTSEEITRYINADAAVELVDAGPTETFRVRGYQGTDATFYTLFGTGAWVVPVVDTSNSMAGIAIVPANATKAEHVAFGSTKTAALEDFKRKVAKADMDAGVDVNDVTEKIEKLIITRVHVDETSVAFYTMTTGDLMLEVQRETAPTSRMLSPGDVVTVTYTVTPGSLLAPVTLFERIAQ